MVAEKHESSMIGLWRIRKEIEQCIMVEQEIAGVASLGADDVWSLNGITAEENRLYDEIDQYNDV
jgi:hypothetical protein